MKLNDLPYIMVKCLICTIIIEIIIALILKIKDKNDLINIVLVNILTNPIVVSLPVYILMRYGRKNYYITFYSLEIITVLVEGFIYKKVLKYKKINPYIISLILNLGSYLIGEIINRI